MKPKGIPNGDLCNCGKPLTGHQRSYCCRACRTKYKRQEKTQGTEKHIDKSKDLGKKQKSILSNGYKNYAEWQRQQTLNMIRGAV